MKIVMRGILSSILAFLGFGCSTQSEKQKPQMEMANSADRAVETNSVERPAVEQNSVRLSDVPEVFRQLRQKGSDGSFAVFMFSDHGKTGSENNINLQFSIEDGKTGLDWVLLAPVNIRDEGRILDFLKVRGTQPRRLTQNEVTYLRAESGDLVEVCQDIMRDLYGIKNDDIIEFLAEGFEFKP